MADAIDLGSIVLGVQVQVLSLAPNKNKSNYYFNILHGLVVFVRSF